MNWERKALDEIIRLLIIQENKYLQLHDKLYALGIEVNLDCGSTKVIDAMTPNMGLYLMPTIIDNEVNPDYLQLVLEEIEENFK